MNNQEQIETFNENWDRFLKAIKIGKLIPVIGKELLVVEVEGEQIEMESLVAEKLIEALHLDREKFGENPSYSEIVYACQNLGKVASNVYSKFETILRESNWPVPEPLLKLAEISGFRLFISTTPDDMLIKALNQVRHSNELETIRCSFFSTKAPLRDLPQGYMASGDAPTTVFKLFGEMSDSPDFTLTEEDVLLCVSRLSFPDEGPENLVNLLNGTAIAQIGCSFKNWLNRFFYCSTRHEALFGGSEEGGLIADSQTNSDGHLRPFLKRNKAEVYPGTAIEFIDELHRRWTEREALELQTDSGLMPAGVRTLADPTNERRRDAVFISYARENQVDALRLKLILEKHVDVWLDEKLEAGQKFEDEIMQKIKECIVFIPLISAVTVSGGGRFFRREWNAAIDKRRDFSHTHPFIQPVIIDDTKKDDPELPKEFKEAHALQLSAVDEDYGKKVARDVMRQLK